MTDERRGFHRLIEAGKGVKKLFDFLSEADVMAEREAEAARVAHAEAEDARAAPTPREPTRPAYHPVEEVPPAPPRRGRACTIEQHPGWRCVVEGPHAKCLVERIP